MDVEVLEAHVTQALANSSPLDLLPELIACVETDDARTLHKTIFALHRVFTFALRSQYYAGSVTSAVDEIRRWLEQHIENYSNTLILFLDHPSADIRACSLDVLMSLFGSRSIAKANSSRTPIHYAHFRLITRKLLTIPLSDELSQHSFHIIELFTSKWFNVYWDVRWLALRELEYFLGTTTEPTVRESGLSNVLAILERMTPLRQQPHFWLQGLENKVRLHTAFGSQSSHQARISACWTLLTPFLVSSVEFSARALAILPVVTPEFRHPFMLMDWISGCVDYGGSVGLLALNTMHHLMVARNLDYPDFYPRLYAFLDRDSLHMKYRSRFLRLLERFMNSTHLPIKLLASFVKRLSRLSLTASPSALVTLIPFIYNIIHRHPQLMVMIHNPTQTLNEDPYDEKEPSPFNTDAISSSLWEIASLQFHYDVAVCSIARLFSEVFSKPSYSLEGFLDQSYSTLFRSHLYKTLRDGPALQDEQTLMTFDKWTLH